VGFVPQHALTAGMADCIYREMVGFPVGAGQACRPHDIASDLALAGDGQFEGSGSGVAGQCGRMWVEGFVRRNTYPVAAFPE